LEERVQNERVEPVQYGLDFLDGRILLLEGDVVPDLERNLKVLLHELEKPVR